MRLWPALLLALPAVACGDDDDHDKGASFSCLATTPQERTCIHYENLTDKQLADEANTCVNISLNTKISAVPACPTDNQVGSCVAEHDGVMYTLITYADGGTTTESAKANCEYSKGTFTPEP